MKSHQTRRWQFHSNTFLKFQLLPWTGTRWCWPFNLMLQHYFFIFVDVFLTKQLLAFTGKLHLRKLDTESLSPAPWLPPAFRILFLCSSLTEFSILTSEPLWRISTWCTAAFGRLIEMASPIAWKRCWTWSIQGNTLTYAGKRQRHKQLENTSLSQCHA